MISDILSYSQSREYLDNVIRTGIKYDLNNIRNLLKLLGHPERDFPVICVAGTNGKGSVAAFLESILTEAGYTVGLNTSPHLVSPRERLRINRLTCTKKEFARAISLVQNAALSYWKEDDPYRPTFFETMTAAALTFFYEQKVDIAIMEAGLGGRLDGTNGTQPLMTIITRLAIDHPKTLGNTLRKISFEKFGLARNNKLLLVGKQRKRVYPIIRDLARFRGSQLHFVDGHWKDKQLTTLPHNNVYALKEFGISGKYQKENVSTAIRAAELMMKKGFSIDSAAIERGVAEAYWPGRMELKETEPRLLIDGSHNLDGILHLISELKKIPAKRKILIYGKVGERSPESTAGKLLPLVDKVFLPPIPVGRATDPHELAHQIRKFNSEISICKSISRAWQMAKSEYRSGDLIIVAGSLYLVGHFKAEIGARFPARPEN